MTDATEAAQAPGDPLPGTRIHVIDFDEGRVTEHPLTDLRRLPSLRESPSVTWINVEGLEDRSSIEALTRAMGLHALTLEDVLNTDQRPKLEDYGDYIYLNLSHCEDAGGGQSQPENRSRPAQPRAGSELRHATAACTLGRTGRIPHSGRC